MFKKYSYSLSVALFSSFIIAAFTLFLISYLGLSPIVFSIIIFIISFITIWGSIILRTASLDTKIRKLYHNVFQLKRYREASIHQYIDEILEQVNLISQKNVKEIDVLTERENYRREFLGNVSHELKTPLFSIQGFLLTLIEGGVEDEKICYKYLNRINKSVDRLTYIVKDLDMISELETGNIKINPKPFNIILVIQEVFDLLEIKANRQNVHLQFDKSYDNIKVIGDLERIQQVIVNLVVNAIKHSNKEETTVTVSFITKGKNVQITVQDDGQGISLNDQKRIFERFFRIERSRSRENGGSGLGLSIVKHILEAHDQKIYVESRLDEGTTFYFNLKKE